jgi:hypothetical protein
VFAPATDLEVARGFEGSSRLLDNGSGLLTA